MNKLRSCLLFSSLSLLCPFCSNCSIKDKAPGYFYTLQEAYFLKRINQEELMELANVHNNDLEIDDDLNRIIVNRIKETEIYNYKDKEDYNNESINNEDISIDRYYGKFGNCYAIIVTNKLEEYEQRYENVNVANVTFNYSNNNEILLWSKNSKTDVETVKLKDYSYYVGLEYNPLITIDEYNTDHFKYYGEYNDTYAYVNNRAGFDMMSKHTIKEYVFIYTSTDDYIKIIFKDKIFDLKTAYLNDILTYDDIKKLYNEVSKVEKDYGIPTSSCLELHGDPIV